MFSFIEKKIIYHAIVDRMLKEEKYDKKRGVISAKELLELTKKRYMHMQEILAPIKKKFNQEMEITDIYFTDGAMHEMSICVWYKMNDKSNFLVISQFDDEIEVCYNLFPNVDEKLITDNKVIISKAFDECYKNNYSIDYEMLSTSGMFSLDSNGEYFKLKTKSDLSGECPNIIFENLHSGLEREINVNDIELKILLENDANMNNVLNNIKVYEENAPKYLLKK